MTQSALSPELLEILSRPHSDGLPAILLSPHLADGIVIFDPLDEQMSVRGDFIPGSIKVNISVIERSRLLLADAKMVLNVIMFPGHSESGNVERFHFQLVDWKSTKQARKSTKHTSKLHPQCPPVEDEV